MSRIMDVDQVWDILSMDEIRNNAPTREYTFDMVRHMTILIEEARMFLAQNPDILQEQVDALTKRLYDLEKERLHQSDSSQD